jgi:uncharacterized BrkB/YihY/UPF0761 family membrane protein
MAKKWWMVFLLIGFGYYANAAFRSHTNENSITAEKAPAEKKTIGQLMEESMGRQMNWLEKWQLQRMEKRMKKGKPGGLFSEKDELSEGFQALPFFGSLLTFGIVYFVMLFTAQDANALRWALWGGLLAVTIITVTQLISLGSY